MLADEPDQAAPGSGAHSGSSPPFVPPFGAEMRRPELPFHAGAYRS